MSTICLIKVCTTEQDFPGIALGTPCPEIFLFMNRLLRFAPTKLARLSQSLRCLQPNRNTRYLTNEELARALDDQIRARYPRSSAAEVEAVVEARRGIWGGTSGGVYVAP
jgi:hypothetical protein